MYLFHTGIEKDPHTYEFYCRGCSFGMGFIFMLYFLNCMKRVLNEALANNESNARSPGRNLSQKLEVMAKI